MSMGAGVCLHQSRPRLDYFMHVWDGSFPGKDFK